MKLPVPGCPTLSSSAPISPITPAQNGAAMRVPKSRTRTPSSGAAITRSVRCVPELRPAKLRNASLLFTALFGPHRVHAALLSGIHRTECRGGVAHELVDHEVIPPRLA